VIYYDLHIENIEEIKMRDIKFKGLHPSVGIIMDVCVIDWMHDEVYFEQGSDVSYPINDCKLMQYSGFTDNSGVDAYDGFIVKITRNNPSWVNEIVNFSEVKFSGCEFYVEFDGKKLTLGNSYWGTEMEVVGNVHENSELLK
jgi:hypothetical protein